MKPIDTGARKGILVLLMLAWCLTGSALADTKWTAEVTVVDIDDRPLAGIEVALGVLNDADKFNPLETGSTDDAGKATITVTTESRSARVAAAVINEPVGRVHDPLGNRAALKPGANALTVRLLPLPDQESAVGGGSVTTAGFFAESGTGSRYSALQTESVAVEPGLMQHWPARVALGRAPVLLVQGLPLSTIQVAPMEVYNQLYDLVEALRKAGRDIWIVAPADVKDPVAGNALAVSDAVAQAAALAGENARVDVVGISLGAVMVRYALAHDEAENGPSRGKVRLFASVDAPHQGANVALSFQAAVWMASGRSTREVMSSYAVQNFLYQWVGAENFSRKSCGFPENRGIHATTAAHDWFYARLNALNGNGYPTLSRNVALANDGLDPRRQQPGDVMHTAHASAKVLIGSIELCREDYKAGPLDVLPGSLPPRDLVPTRIDSGEIRFSLDVKFEPTFIPTASALDIREGRSQFDATFTPSGGPYPHGELPPGALDFLLKELLL
jgi:hypothetical protein